MLKGIHVSLLIGPAVPIPVSQEVLDALTNVQVISSTDDKMNGFELTFVLSTRSPLHTIFLLSAGSPIPLPPLRRPTFARGFPAPGWAGPRAASSGSPSRDSRLAA